MTEPKEYYYLVNLYEGAVTSFDTSIELIAYLKRKDKGGSLMGETVFEVFKGRHLATAPYWVAAFGK